MPPETLSISLQGGKFLAQVLRSGQGHPLVYLHGAIGQKGWAPFLDRLAGSFTVYAPFLPGYGQATGLEHLADVVDLALYQFELMDALGLASAHVVGHFLGGMAAAEMAALSPGYVDRLVLAAPAGLWRDDAPVADLLAMSNAELRNHLWAAASEGGSPPAPDIDASERVQDLTAAGKFLWPIPDKGLKRRAYRIKAPTLIVWGEQDGLIPPVYAEDFARLVPGSQVARLPNAGHLLMLEQAQAFTDLVAGFLSR